MKRWTWRILICLFLGVVTTVGVAWGLAAIGEIQPLGIERIRMLDPGPVMTEDSLEELRYHYHGLGSHCILWQAATLFDLRKLAFANDTDDVGLVAIEDITYLRTSVSPAWLDKSWQPSATTSRVREARGWPLLALSGGYDRSIRGDVTRVTAAILIGSPPDHAAIVNPVVPVDRGVVLPLGPIFPGFLINTLFYAAIWFVLFLGIGATRRTIRRRRGRCPQCGYDLRGQQSAVSDQPSVNIAGCPECGCGREV